MPKRLEATAPAGAERLKGFKEAPPASAKEGRHRRLDQEKENEPTPLKTEVPIHCKKWIDYTSKYGLGYVLSNGAVGVFFNDATKIILGGDEKAFKYYERKQKEDICLSHTLEDYPKEIEKKVTLLKHFKSYLD